MRYFFLIVFFPIFIPALFAQPGQDDVVYLVNGTFLRGKIVEMVPGKSLRLALLKSSDTLEIRMDEGRHGMVILLS